MGTTYRYIANPHAPDEVIGWFRALRTPPEEVPSERFAWLHFRSIGPIVHDADGRVDPCRSPVVTLFSPRVRRGILWTVGEVHFLPTPLRRSRPALHRVSSSFKKWLEGFDCVFSHEPGVTNEWSYYLEGSVQNWDPPIYALPSGLEALRSGQYFVAEEDNDFRLDKLCAALRLRGVQCTGNS